MEQQGFGTYKGRKSFGRQLLIVIAVLLAIALALAVLAAVILPNYIEYTPDGPRVVLPFFSWTKPAEDGAGAPTPAPTPSEEVIVVVETPAPDAAAPTPTPKPSMPARRKTPRGLEPVTAEELIAGTELPSGRGGIVDVKNADLSDAQAIRKGCRALPYTAAYVRVSWTKGSQEDTVEAFRKNLTQQVEDLACLGFDEIILNRPNFAKVDAAATAGHYIMVREKLDELGFKGRLSLVCGKDVFTDETLSKAQLTAIAGSFDRIYAAAGEGWSGVNILKSLTKGDLDFKGGQSDIVTVTRKAQTSAKYAWAVLPQ